MKETLLTEKRDGIPCVIIFPWYQLSIALIKQTYEHCTYDTECIAYSQKVKT